MVMKFCMGPSVTKRIRLQPSKKILPTPPPPFSPHYDIFGGEPNTPEVKHVETNISMSGQEI
jgi:hypothetical protein